MKKRRQVKYLKTLVTEVSERLSLPEVTTTLVTDELFRLINRDLLNQYCIDIHGNRFKITERKLNPQMGRSITYKITSEISNELKDSAEEKFSASESN